jgi:hypothetical protein
MTEQRGEWRLLRLDDNGNEIEVARFPDRDSAERAKRDFEARGHKQMWRVTRRAQ